jgi:hypothetical protein
LVERKYHHVVELSLATMINAFIPLIYWDQIFESVVFVINRLPSLSGSRISPFQTLFNQVPDYQLLKVLGCECFPLLRPYNNHKLQPRSTACVFIGYSSVYKGYCCYDIYANKTYIPRHVRFNEIKFPFAHISSIPISSSPVPIQNTLTIIPSVSPTTSGSPISSTSSSQIPHSMLTRQKTNTRKLK